MIQHRIPPNIGRVRVAMALGNKFAVWNGKQGRGEFRVLCRKRKEAEELAAKINRREYDGEGSSHVLRPKWCNYGNG